MWLFSNVAVVQQHDSYRHVRVLSLFQYAIHNTQSHETTLMLAFAACNCLESKVSHGRRPHHFTARFFELSALISSADTRISSGDTRNHNVKEIAMVMRSVIPVLRAGVFDMMGKDFFCDVCAKWHETLRKLWRRRIGQACS